MATDSTSASRDPARRCSSTSELFGGIFARGGVAAEVDDCAWLRAMLDVEAALARACAAEGLIPREAAETIAAACRAGDLDIAAMGREAAESATPVIALVGVLRERVGSEVAEHVHAGSTSQDILDTGAMLVAARALRPLLEDASAAAEAAAALADAHRDTVLPGRTLLRQALPMCFGLKAAGWLMGIEEAVAGLVAVRDEVLAVQMGGPVGDRDPAIAARVAADLGLVDPVLPWHTHRARPVALAAALGTLAGALAKVALDVALLAQDEVAEVREGGGAGRGGSSAMPHKQNPVAAVAVRASAERVPGLVASMFGAMAQEHERAAGAWQAEWGTLTDLLRLTGSAAAWAHDLLEHLEVDAERMRQHAQAMPSRSDGGAAGELIDRALLAHRAARR
jgi:3-carboxy-cis,cis-muconate cycloisomerase